MRDLWVNCDTYFNSRAEQAAVKVPVPMEGSEKR
jgi:hypothetical protein